MAGAAFAAYRLHVSTPGAANPPAGVVLDATDPSPRIDAAPQEPASRVMDEAGFVDSYNTRRMDEYLQGVYNESGVDVRFIFAREITGDLESFALKRARELGMGRDVNKRSLLFVYDIGRERMRVEVGPGMEGIFPDGFVGYLMREQTMAFFASGNRGLGLKSTLNVVSHRLREAALDGDYDPRAVTFITNSARLATGGGATARARVGTDLRTGVATNEARARFGPQATVAGAHARYLEALRERTFLPDLPLFTADTRDLLNGFPITPPFADFILFSEYGHKYTIVERGDLAILFFTTTPLVSAHLFRRSPAGWQLDLAAEVRDTREYIGGAYTWTMRLSGDDYSRVFADLFAEYGPEADSSTEDNGSPPPGILRPAGGDNRPLPTRVASYFTPTARRGGDVSLLLPVAGPHSDDFGYPTQAIDRLAVRRLLLERSYDALDVLLAAYADSVLRDHRLEYRLVDAYEAFVVAVPSLEPLLTEWVQQRPTSAAALIARASFFRASGWNARGSSSSGDTPDQQFVAMGDFFRRSTADLAGALRLAPNSIVAHRQLMNIAMAVGDAAASRQILDRAIKFQPYSFLLREAHMKSLLPRWGGSYEAMARFAEESAPYAKRNPRVGTLRGFVDWDRGRVLGRAGQNTQALEAYDSAMRFGDYWEFRFDRGRLYSRNDQEQKSVKDFNGVLLQRPQDADALNERSSAGYELGRQASGEAAAAYYSQAFRDIELAAALDPTDEDYQQRLAFMRENIPEFAPRERP